MGDLILSKDVSCFGGVNVFYSMCFCYRNMRYFAILLFFPLCLWSWLPWGGVFLSFHSLLKDFLVGLEDFLVTPKCLDVSNHL